MSNLPKCKACGCEGIHACIGQPISKLSRKEKRNFWRKLSKAIKQIKQGGEK